MNLKVRIQGGKMKKLIILTGLVLLLYIPIFSQVYVGDVDINKLDIEYCEVVGQRKFLGLKAKITVDYGQKRVALWKSKIKDENGKTMSFMGVMGALNFMYKNGWEYVDSFIISHKEQLVYHYLLRKKKKTINAPHPGEESPKTPDNKTRQE